MTQDELLEKLKVTPNIGLPESKENQEKITVIRNNKNTDEDAVPYLGFVRPEETPSGTYYDLSLVIFPDNPVEVTKCVVGIVVGTQLFRNDYETASQPWWPREFLRFANSENFGKDYCAKIDFSDTNSELPSFFEKFGDESFVKNIKKKYGKYIQAATMVDLTENSKGVEELQAWLRMYALLRGWVNSNKTNYEKTSKFLNKYLKEPKLDTAKDIYELLSANRFIVLQGAPGVGKTYNALQIASEYYKSENIFFEQFHAETSYSDFVWGLHPRIHNEEEGANGNRSEFVAKKGVLLQAIEKAKNTNDRVLLIIDEINRANLSNVLGPVFYLFERNATNRSASLEIGEMKLSQLPENIDVIATMNTADRSLAVVDFALRRRFTWYTIKPHPITPTSSNIVFRGDEFDRMAQIFRCYASDAELNLQPGPSYFLVDKEKSDEGIRMRLRYELLPLIKEYLLEGYLSKAQNEFNQYFIDYIKQPIFE